MERSLQVCLFEQFFYLGKKIFAIGYLDILQSTKISFISTKSVEPAVTADNGSKFPVEL